MEAVKPWGELWGGARYRLPDGREVTMRRRGQRCRFFTDDGEQVGPEHANVAPAVVAAAYAGWWDLNSPDWLNVGLIREVREGATSAPPARSNAPTTNEPATTQAEVPAEGDRGSQGRTEHHPRCPRVQAWDVFEAPCECPPGWPRREVRPGGREEA